MQDQVRQVLCDVVARVPEERWVQPETLRGLLAQCLGADTEGARLEINLLVHAAQSGVPEALRRLPSDASVSPLVEKMVAEHGLAEAKARWAVESWMAALGVRGALPAATGVVETMVQESPRRSNEPAYYIGLILGIAGGALAVKFVGIQHNLIQLGFGLVCGVGLGFVLERVATSLWPPGSQ